MSELMPAFRGASKLVYFFSILVMAIAAISIVMGALVPSITVFCFVVGHILSAISVACLQPNISKKFMMFLAKLAGANLLLVALLLPVLGIFVQPLNLVLAYGFAAGSVIAILTLRR